MFSGNGVVGLFDQAINSEVNHEKIAQRMAARFRCAAFIHLGMEADISRLHHSRLWRSAYILTLSAAEIAI